MKKSVLLTCILFVFSQSSFSQAVPDLYLGLTPPGYTPEAFAPGIISLESRKEHTITFSPSGHELFYAVGEWPTRTVLYVQYLDGNWTSPVTAPFSLDRSVDEPSFSPDGNSVYYYAYQPGAATNADICHSEKSANSWGAPVSVGSPLNTSGDEYHPCMVNDSSLYFINSSGKVCRSQFAGGTYQARVVLPAVINDASSCYRDAYVAADESYIIFNSVKSGGFGGYDLYISFKKADGTWTVAQNFGNTINTAAWENSADITPDGKYMTYDSNGDIYWVAIENTIESLRVASGVTTSANNGYENQDILFFPNPSNGLINIALGKLQRKTATIDIIDTKGQRVFSQTYNDISETTIDLTRLPKGLYLAAVIIDGVKSNTRICLK
jgi:hypothetical protein